MKHEEKDEKNKIEIDKTDSQSKLKTYEKKKNVQKFLHFKIKR